MSGETDARFYPKDLTELPINPQDTDMHSAQLREIFNNLDKRIDHLSRKIEKHRTFGKDNPDHESSKCVLLCQKMKGTTKRRCMDNCSMPSMPFEAIEDLANDFPIDVERLRTDHTLREEFERHQKTPDTIRNTSKDAELIPDLYTMPIAVLALPETSWDRAMTVMKSENRTAERENMVQNWLDRSSSYPPEAQDELSRKINRHDTDNILADTITEKSRNSKRRSRD